MKNLTKGEHAHRLTRFYTGQEDLLPFVLDNNLDEPPCATKEAKEWMIAMTAAGRTAKNEPHLIIEWYNLQFGTDFTEERIKKFILLG
jgi:hypothetical protein